MVVYSARTYSFQLSLAQHSNELTTQALKSRMNTPTSAPLYNWLDTRTSGILLHISSLPSDTGIGNLGQGAYQFLDFMAATGAKIWQLCPLGPTGFGDSPYQCFSAFAGNPYFIDFAPLVAAELLSTEDLCSASRTSCRPCRIRRPLPCHLAHLGSRTSQLCRIRCGERRRLRPPVRSFASRNRSG